MEYKFEISNCITVNMNADSAEEARMMIIDTLYNYAEDMIDDCIVSDGEEIVKERDIKDEFTR